MKKKYSLSIADVELNVTVDESPETVEYIVGVIDRKMRDILLRSKYCPKTQAALLCALDYCSERIKAQRKVKSLESKLAIAEGALEEVEMENEELRKEIDELKMMIAK